MEEGTALMKPGFLKEPMSGNLALLVLRCSAGLSFALHGYDKIFGEDGVAGFAVFVESLGIPMPLVAAWLAALSEFVGGLALITGLGARLMSIPLVFTMLTAAFLVHPGEFPGNMELPVSLAAAALVIGLMGPGKYAVHFGNSKK
jgi:putative oxidoreductase